MTEDRNDSSNGEVAAESNEKNDVVTPWDVHTGSAKGVDYEALRVKFGCSSLKDDAGAALIARFEKLSGKRAHHLLRRRLFFAHRDFESILNRLEQKKPFYLYTGRGASNGSLHLGHLIPFIFTKYLQEVFDVPLIIQLTDDEKFIWKDITLEQSKTYSLNNIKDILAVGFDPAKTFIFTNTEYMSSSPAFYPNVLRMWKCLNYNRAQKIFGFTSADCIGKSAFPAIEAAPCFSSSFPQIFNGRKDIPCLIPSAIDQDPFFRMTRDEAPRLKYNKPATIYGQFLPSLEGGADGKMSSSHENSCIFLSDTPNQIKKKIGRCFSGGQETVELQREKGADCDVDVSYQMLRFFLDDDDRLEDIREKYSKGEMLTGEVKAIAIETVQKLVAELQERRKSITDATVKEFTVIRKLSFDY